jgi:hypothetical protein
VRARLVPASLVHIGPLALNLRTADRVECEALGRKPKDALRLSLRTSLHALTALDPEGKPVAMFGVCALGLLAGRGTPWFLGTERVFDYGRDLMVRGPRIVAWWHETFDVMENIVAVENVKAVALLKRWGAEIGGETRTHRGVEFVPFVFRAAIQGQAAAA